MNWSDDPLIQQALQEQRVRRGLWIQAAIWMPLFIAAFGAFLFFLADVIFDLDKGGTIFLCVVLAVLSGLFGFQGFQAVLDLRRHPAELSGWITRRWARSDSFIIKTHYIRIEKHIFRIERALHGEVGEGDYVTVRYYPHSAVVVAIEKVLPPEGEEPPLLVEPRKRR